MKKILLLLAVCTVTTANAAHDLMILNETQDYRIEGYLTASDTSNCNATLSIGPLEIPPGDNIEAEVGPNMIRDVYGYSMFYEGIWYNNTRYTSNSEFRNLSNQLFVNGSFDWTSFNFKAPNLSNNPLLGDGAVLKFNSDQVCDSNLPTIWDSDHDPYLNAYIDSEAFLIDGIYYLVIKDY